MEFVDPPSQICLKARSHLPLKSKALSISVDRLAISAGQAPDSGGYELPIRVVFTGMLLPIARADYETLLFDQHTCNNRNVPFLYGS